MKLSTTATAVLDQMSIIDPDYFKRSPKPYGEEDWDEYVEYVEFIKDCEVKNAHNNFLDALEKELELKSLPIKRRKEQVVDKDGIIWDGDYYVGSLEPSDSSFSFKPQKKPGDHSFNDICSMEMDSFQYWLKEASIGELEVFGKFRIQDKPRKRKRNIIQLLLGK